MRTISSNYAHDQCRRMRRAKSQISRFNSFVEPLDMLLNHTTFSQLHKHLCQRNRAQFLEGTAAACVVQVLASWDHNRAVQSWPPSTVWLCCVGPLPRSRCQSILVTQLVHVQIFQLPQCPHSSINWVLVRPPAQLPLPFFLPALLVVVQISQQPA